MNYEGAGYIYAIRNRVNGHAYIGSTKGYKSRWHSHRSSLRRKTHHSFVLQRAWDKYGEDAFEFKVLLVCPLELRVFYEAKLMALETYNVLRTPRESGVRGGWTHSEEFKAKMSTLHKGKKLSEEHRRKISVAATGRICDGAFREKARARQLGVIPTAQTKAKLSLLHKGRKVSLETRAKLSESQKNTTARKINVTLAKVNEIKLLVAAGIPTSHAIKSIGMSTATYYKYHARLDRTLEDTA